MPILDYNSYAQEQEQKQSESNYKVGFFGIKDGETKVVKVPYTTVEELTMLNGAHYVKTASGKCRLIDCIKTNGNKDTCPLCKSGAKVVDRFLAKLVEFPVDSNGNVTGLAKSECWAAPKSVAEQFRGLIKIYKENTPNIVFFIKRYKGSNGFVEYKVEPDTDNFFDSTKLVANFSDFADFSFEGTTYHTKTVEEMEQFIVTGEFPAVEKTEQVVKTQVTNPSPFAQQPTAQQSNVGPFGQQPNNPFGNTTGKKYY